MHAFSHNHNDLCDACDMHVSVSPEQRLVIESFLKGQDVFISLPTGMGEVIVLLGFVRNLQGRGAWINHSSCKSSKGIDDGSDCNNHKIGEQQQCM